jgi:putative hydrolase of the HAD superfamily
MSTSNIRHISLDFYGTLVVPNPNFALERNKYLAGVLGVDPATVASVYKETKRFLDSSAEVYGLGLPVRKAWEIFFHKFNKADVVDNIVINEVIHTVECIYLENPHTVPEQTSHAIHMLRRRKMFTFNISSNTNFISGETVRHTLMSNAVLPLFDFTLFSDLVGYSKPSRAFFNMVTDFGHIPKDSIIHVGDNCTTDFNGAQNFGINAKLIQGPEEVAPFLESFL